MTVNINLGDPSQDSYVAASQADTYFGNRRNVDEWNALTTANKEVVLKQAAQDMEIFNYVGNKYYDPQGLVFPRDNHEIVTGNCVASITNTSFKNTSLKSSTYGVYPTNYWKYSSVHITNGTPLYDIKEISLSNAVTGSVTTKTAFTATPTTNTEFIIFAPIDKNIRNAQCEQALFILKNANIETLYNYKNIGAEEVEIGDTRVRFTSGDLDKVAIAPEARKLLSRWIRKQVRVGRA